VGGSNHLPAVLFERAAKVQFLHVPYKGEGQAVLDLVGGKVSGSFMYAFTALPQIRGGKLRALAVTMRKRNPSLPDVPTMEEAGFPGVEFESWLGLVAPAGTPRHIIDVLNREISAAMHTPAIEAEATAIGTQIYTQSPEEFGAVIKRDAERYASLIRELGISME
jgi:tripartite-type tricarboxylate transporter receptor subunit TctC